MLLIVSDCKRARDALTGLQESSTEDDKKADTYGFDNTRIARLGHGTIACPRFCS